MMRTYIAYIVTISLFLGVNKYYDPKYEQFADKGFAIFIVIYIPKTNVRCTCFNN